MLTRRDLLGRAGRVLAGAALAGALRPTPGLAGDVGRTALAFTWGDSAATDLAFRSFFGRDHTLVLRFLPQYPHAYAGPLLTGRGYAIEQGDFFADEPAGRTKLVARIGARRVAYAVPLPPFVWRHLAVVRRGDAVTLYLDGRALRPSLEVGGAAPGGRLRLGRGSAAGAQLYGLVDDLALARRALSPARIAALARTPFLTGGERDVRPVAIAHGARTVPVSDGRDGAADAAAIPFGSTAPMRLPFAPDEAWEVIGGFDDPSGSHRGYAAFGWDLVLAGRPRVETAGRPFFAVAAGTVERVVQRFGSGPPRWNYVTVRQGPGERCDYLHLAEASAGVAAREAVETGRMLGAVGDTGVAPGAHHLHLAVTTLGEGAREAPGYVTIPASFTGYEASDDRGVTWRPVARGVPAAGQWVRLPAG